MIHQNTIDEVKKRLIEAYNPLEIYLFGSYAWGHPDEESDLDLLIVVDHHPSSRYQSMVTGHKALIGLNISKDLLVYSKDEFNKCASDVTSICNKVIRSGKKIYAKA